MSLDKTFYTTSAHSEGGRDGYTALDNGSLRFDLTGFDKDEEGVNPEQLFAMGYAACFGGAAALVAKEFDFEPQNIKTSAKVSLGALKDGSFNLAVTLILEAKGVSQDEAQTLIERAHEVCPYSNATRGNVEVELVAKAV